MDIFVGAEYLIANALIALRKNGMNQIKVSQLQEFGIQVQACCIEKSITAVFLLSSDKLSDAIYNFSDYFSYEDFSGEPVIRLKSDADFEDLKERFVGYLPTEILKIILEKAKDLTAA